MEFIDGDFSKINAIGVFDTYLGVQQMLKSEIGNSDKTTDLRNRGKRGDLVSRFCVNLCAGHVFLVQLFISLGSGGFYYPELKGGRRVSYPEDQKGMHAIESTSDNGIHILGLSDFETVEPLHESLLACGIYRRIVYLDEAFNSRLGSLPPSTISQAGGNVVKTFGKNTNLMSDIMYALQSLTRKNATKLLRPVVLRPPVGRYMPSMEYGEKP
ncbi:uncharacterized protein BDR25DRAFT_361123 [Lindgomyces ingoldianus]|uniref:Uncharacterized protein n=1 Tax=Lindgomyces ingoldianus TaxID=673940 RepID=A0ACB6QD90_9PLEO|nr:uncharacterized protein BDR25DRAFT_361123 [Lindgomyces ingoldianus]KAF2464896.1 hypothetical protein BDR25DRAFT_361123 [Lindgomyces ingoldianus]